MPRPRTIQGKEALVWLEILLAYAFSKKYHREALLSLLDIARDSVFYDEILDWQLAYNLLHWAEKYVSPDDWQRLQARVRKRRNQA